MASDPETDPGLDAATKKGPKAPTPEATAQADQHIGAHGELVLPDVVPIVNLETATKFGVWLNRWWIRTHYLLRGIAGTGAEWFTFFVGAAAQYPKVSVVLLAIGTVFTEEKYSEHPIMTNVMKYAMTSYDADAAEKIFAEKPVENNPIGKAAKKAVEEATKTFMDSSEYQELQTEIAQDVQMQARRQAYLGAGMVEDAHAVDEEIKAAREERRAVRKAKQAEAAPEEVAPTLPEVHHVVALEAPEPEPERVEVPVEEIETPAPEVQEEPLPESEPEVVQERRKRRAPDPAKKLIRDAADMLLTPPEKKP